MPRPAARSEKGGCVSVPRPAISFRRFVVWTVRSKSVLENHHVAAFFRTMIDNECNILQNLSKQEYKQFRSLMVELVLHTDMSLHFSQIKNLKHLLQTASAGGR